MPWGWRLLLFIVSVRSTAGRERVRNKAGRSAHAETGETGQPADPFAYFQLSTGTQLQKRLRSPWTLSTRPTGTQYFRRRREATG